MGIARLAETPVRAMSGKSKADKLSPMERILCSSIGGAVGCWNQPIEVVRVEMQSMAKAEPGSNRPVKLTIGNTLSYIYKENGIKGLYRGVQPRIALGIWQTICMVSFADYVKVSNQSPRWKKLKADSSLFDNHRNSSIQLPRRQRRSRLHRERYSITSRLYTLYS